MLAVAGEIDALVLFIHRRDAIDHPFAISNLAHQRAIALVEIDMLEAGALRKPEEAAALHRKEAIAAQVNPGCAFLRKHFGALAGARFEAREIQAALFAVHGNRAQAAIRPPEDARQIDLLAKVQVHPDRLAALS